MPLLWAIRDIVGLIGTKFGCGVGACGASTVHIDGQAVRSCLTTLADAQGHEIVTIEGLSADGGNYGVDQLRPEIAGQYLIETSRLRGVLDLVAANSNCGQKLPPRRGRGIAVHRSFLSYVAVVAHVAVGNDGQIIILRLDLAIDCGTVVNPDRVRAQLEGAAIMSIDNALYSHITVKNGSVEQSNYTDYLVPRIDITPETHVYFAENTHLPGGVGEPGVPPTAPAICNAIYAATGKRIRALPIDPQPLKV